jgi:hypothetical protein
VARRSLLIVLGVGVEPGGSRPRSARELKGPGPPTAPCDMDAPVSSTSRISGDVALVIVPGAADSCTIVASSSGTRVSTPLASATTGWGGNDPSFPTMASAAPTSATEAGASAVSTNWEGGASRLSLDGGGAGASAVASTRAAGAVRAASSASAAMAGAKLSARSYSCSAFVDG